MAFGFVALDIGNVLCDLRQLDFPLALSRATGTSMMRIAEVFRHQAWHAMEVGDTGPDVFRRSILDPLQSRLADAAFDECWNLIPVPREGADALVARLRVPYAIWSNTDPIHSAHIAAGLRCMDTAVHLNLSHLVRARKPDHPFYERGLTALGARPQDVLFIDDRPENLDAAAALGIRVEAALTLVQVEAALHKHGAL